MSAKVALVTGKITIDNGGSLLLTAADGSIDDLRAQGFFVTGAILEVTGGQVYST